MDANAYAELRAELLREGYLPVAPSSGDPELDQIDPDVSRQARCPGCGGYGLEYRPFSKHGSYRAFAVCPACGEAQEF